MTRRRRRACAAVAIAAALLVVPAAVDASEHPAAYPLPQQMTAYVGGAAYDHLGDMLGLTATVEVATDEAWGSGTVIGHDADGGALILTARHVLGDDAGEVSSARAWVGVEGRASVWVVDRACSTPDLDICVVRTEPYASSAVTELAEPRDVGTMMHTYTAYGEWSGELDGQVWTVGQTYGVADASAISDHTSWSDVAEMSLQGHPGDSGAGVIDDRGRLVGVYVGSSATRGIAVMGERFVETVEQLQDEVERRARVAEAMSRLTAPR